MRKHKKIRVNWTIDLEALNHLARVKKEKGRSMSEIVELLIFDKLSDPIKILEEENRQMALKINANQERIAALEEIAKVH
jgi:predicted CopG family antitoxin